MLLFFLDLPNSKLYHFIQNERIGKSLACGLRLCRVFRPRVVRPSGSREALDREDRR